MYSMSLNVYDNLIIKQLNSGYKHVNKHALSEINDSHIKLIEKLGLLDRTQTYCPQTSHCLMKDHKPDFLFNPIVRLICPMKSDLGNITKQVIDQIISIVRGRVGLPLWKHTGDVITWFDTIENKKKYEFIQFNITNYCNSITPILLNRALIFTRNFVSIPKSNMDIILAT